MTTSDPRDKRELDLTIEKRVQATQTEILVKARQEAEDALKSQVSQKELQIAAMARTIEDLKRKAEQGSQQTQGEALEVELEGMLRGRFPLDLIEPIGKGEIGGDIVQRVNGTLGQCVVEPAIIVGNRRLSPIREKRPNHFSGEARKQLETIEFREPYRMGGVQRFGEKRAIRRIMGRFCRLGVQSPS